jgi:predicted RNase H-like nuclease (RuvC/YqgF family)
MEAVRNSQREDDTHSRLSVLENNVNIINHNVEKLEYQIDQNYATLHSRISDLRDDLRSDFETKNERIIEKLEEHNKSSAHQSQILQNRISQIEKWRWMIMGGALVVGYVLAHVKLENFF